MKLSPLIRIFTVIAAFVPSPSRLSAGVEPITVKTPVRKNPVSFAREVAPILEDHCVGCHGQALAENRLDLERVASMLKGGKRGPALVPGKADESLLFRMSAHRVEPIMPPADKPANRPLDPDQLGLIKLWIDQGARDDSAETSGESQPIAAVELSEPPASVQAVYALDLTADGRQLAAGRGNLVSIYDVDSGVQLATFKGGKDVVQSLRYSPDQRLLAVGGYEQVLLFSTVEWTPGLGVPRSALVPLPGAGPALTLLTRRCAFVQAVPIPAHLVRMVGPHRDRVLALDFSPDGKLLAAGGGEPSQSGEITIWEVGKGLLVRKLESTHSDTVLGLRFSPDGTRLASAAADKFLKVSNLADGKLVRSFEGHTHHVLGVDWQADGKRLVSAGADQVLKVWDYESGEQIRTLNGPKKAVTAVRWVAGKPEILASSGDGSIRFWNPDNPSPRRSYTGASEYAESLAIARDGSRVAAGCSDGSIHIWEGKSGKHLRTIPPRAIPSASSKVTAVTGSDRSKN